MNDFDRERFHVWHMNVSAAYYAKASTEPVTDKLALPSVTLVCADCIHIDYAIAAIERCKALCDFGAVKLLTSVETNYPHRVEIDHLGSLSDYSVFMLSRIHEYVDTTHMLVCQHDGWVLNVGAWSPEWLERDYVGPLFIHKHQTNEKSVGSGGFSLRSKRLMELVSRQLPRWAGNPDSTADLMRRAGCYEDGAITLTYRELILGAGMRYATPVEASKFAQGGNRDPAYHVVKPFGFHGLWTNIDHSRGVIDVTQWDQGQGR